MVLSIAEFLIRPGDEEAFVAAYHRAVRYIRDAEGCRSVRLSRSVEDPCRFFMRVDWETIEAHTQVFYRSEGFVQWRDAVSGYFLDPPVVEHVVEIPENGHETDNPSGQS
ncbi:antibiotic biosynthesis monooxygenase [Solihabitans fulvus]|uniref:Antibiotic biosynthesis monooxygenase n=1 Tax=Solihabitans fulvus TaxID=1892852 RepID=A0A5B2XD23_9PSEU|nr:antibiotic biosynthesis monooxygenase [Solihabitans fulvus]KAA2261638.1 antibiotic biosynthesis monooxygenase [Solihabitans fulvus]